MNPSMPRRAARWLPGVLLLVLTACTLGGSAVLEPDVDASAPSADVDGDGIVPGACVQLVPRALTVVPPSGVRVQLDAAGCDGAEVPALAASSLRVFEDGDPVDPAESGLAVRLMRPSLRVSVLVLLDLSGSVVAADQLEPARAALVNLLDALAGPAASDTGPFVEVSVQTFATRDEPMREVLAFTSCPDALAALRVPGALASWRPSDTATDLYGSVVDAVGRLKQRGSPATPDTRGLLLLLSDGRDTVGTTPSALGMAAVHELDGTWALAVGTDAAVDRLQALATGGPTEALAGWERTAADMRARVLAWRNEASRRFLLGYCSPRGGGEHRITVEARQGDTPVEVRMAPLHFDATGFTGGCDAGPVANPCGWGAVGEHACGVVDDIPCGTCGTLDRCLDCSNEGLCVSP